VLNVKKMKIKQFQAFFLLLE